MTKETATASSEDRPRWSWWRWLWRPTRWVLVLILLFSSLFIAVELILRSDLPRQWTIDIAQSRTGLRVEIDHLRATWGGRTIVRGVRVGLPLAGEDLAVVDSIDVQHAPLWRLPLSGIDITSVIVDRPSISARQDVDGRWNLQELLALLTRGNTDGVGGPIVDLPEVRIRDGALLITDRLQRQATLNGMTMRGAPAGGAGWTFQLDLDGTARDTFAGQVMLGGRYSHELTFNLQEITPFIQPLVTALLPELRVRGIWRGIVTTEGELRGRVRLDEVQVDETRGTGTVELVSDGHDATVTLAAVHITDPRLDGHTLVLDHGIANWSQNTIHVERVVGRIGDGVVQARGRFDVSQGIGAAAANWTGIDIAGIQQDGTAELTYREPSPGSRIIEVDVTSRGTFDELTWDGGLTGEMRGSDWQKFTWRIDVKPSRLTLANHRVDLQGATARGALRGTELTLDEITVDSPLQVVANGRVDLDAWDWHLGVAATKPADAISARLNLPDALDMNFRLDGTRDAARITRGRIHTDGFRARFEGEFDRRGSRAVRLATVLELSLDRFDVPLRTTVGNVPLRASLDVIGTLDPLLVAWSGSVTSTDLSWMGQSLGRFDFPVNGTVSPSGLLRFQGDRVSLLGGQWRFAGDYHLVSRNLSATAAAEDVRLQNIDSLLPETQRLRGLLSLRDVTASIEEGDFSTLALDGRAELRSLSVQGFRLGELQTPFAIRDGVAQFSELTLSQGDGTIAGSATVDLAGENLTHAVLKIQQWPLKWPGLDASLEASGDVRAAVTRSGLRDAHAQINTDVRWMGEPLGNFDIDATVNYQTVRLAQLTGTVFGGTVSGEGEVSLDALMLSRASFRWNDLDLPQVVAAVPQLDLIDEFGEVTGRVSGQLTAAPSEDRRSPDALDVRIVIEPDEASFRNLAIERSTARFFIEPTRWVLDEGTLQLADGSLRAWGRLNRRGHEFDTFLRLDMDHLDIAPLLAAVSVDDRPMPGRLSGRVTLHVGPGGPDVANGQVNVSIEESDLARLGPLTALYNAMNLSIFSASEPQGYGSLAARIEGGDIRIEEFRYTNRGAYARAIGTIRHARRGAEAELDVLALGSYQPLPQVSVLREMDSAIRALQRNATSLRLTGPVNDVRSESITTGTATRFFRAMLLGGSSDSSYGEQ